MNPGTLDLDPGTRRRLWQAVSAEVEQHFETAGEGPVAAGGDPAEIGRWLAEYDFARPIDPVQLVRQVTRGLRAHQVHAAHPGYYGLFNPRPTALGVAADTLVAALNPQLAAWSHSPLAVEIEQHLLRAFAVRFGFPADSADGTFASGGAEANLTAVLAALDAAWPGLHDRGLRTLDADPLLYVSAEAHHSMHKAAAVSGLGVEAVRAIPVDGDLRMNLAELRARLAADRAAGHRPFLLVGTAGTTGAGVIDPLPELAAIAREAGLWFHVDAAWGGAAVLVPELAPLLRGIEQADSITMDAHKWLSVPVGAGMFLTRHRESLARVFRVSTSYMPRAGAGPGAADPYLHSLQWSRRFIGLKLFLSLAAAGWEGYRDAIAGQHRTGARLRALLPGAGWRVLNRTELPLVCFADARYTGPDPARQQQRIADRVVASGTAWISTVRLGPEGTLALRACITNYRTGEADLTRLLGALEQARGEPGD